MTDDQDTTTEATSTEATVATTPASRRSFVTKGVLAAAVGAAASVAIKSPASAADGSVMIVGDTNAASSDTRLFGGTTLRVSGGFSHEDSSIYGENSGSAGALYGVQGRFVDPGAQSAGVYGYHSNTSSGGMGVKGESVLGTGVYGVKTDSAGGGIGVHGRTESTSAGEGVLGESVGTEGYGVRGRALGTRSIGVSGEATDGVGVSGESADGTGVSGTAVIGVGVRGSGPTADFVAVGSGIIQITPTMDPAITPTTSGTVGSIARSVDGSLWFCYAANMWRRLDIELPDVPAPSGVYYALTPGRVYDSRQEPLGRFSGDENRTISVADARSVTTYAVTVADLVPAGATSVTGNVVAIAPDANGFLAINPGGVTAVTASTLNFTAGQNIANGSTFALNATREVECVFGPGASAHMALDITGYTL